MEGRRFVQRLRRILWRDISMQIIDYCVLFSTILVVILIGWLSGRNTCCTDSSKEFLLTEKGINKLQAGFSMAATDFGGSGLVGAIGYCYFVGISGIWWNLAAAPAFILVGLFLAKKFNRMDCATLPEYFGKRYGKGVKLLSCILHILTNIAALSVQFTVSCTVLHIITGFNINVSLVISVLIVLFLTSGGLRAVVNTDAVLFIIIVISILLMVPFSIRAAGGYATLKAMCRLNSSVLISWAHGLQSHGSCSACSITPRTRTISSEWSVQKTQELQNSVRSSLPVSM